MWMESYIKRKEELIQQFKSYDLYNYVDKVKNILRFIITSNKFKYFSKIKRDCYNVTGYYDADDSPICSHCIVLSFTRKPSHTKPVLNRN